MRQSAFAVAGGEVNVHPSGIMRQKFLQEQRRQDMVGVVVEACIA